MKFEKNWTRVMSANDPLQVSLGESLLKQNGIISHVVNHSDAAIPSIGEAELFTREEDAEKAKEILKKGNLI